MSSPRNAENPRVRISAFFAKSLIQVTHLDRSSGARDADMLKIKPGTGPGFRRRRVPALAIPCGCADIGDREVGGGRATRQPGQVRKEAALTSSGSGASSTSYPCADWCMHGSAGVPPAL